MITWTQAIVFLVFVVGYEIYRSLERRIDAIERRLTAHEQGRMVRP